MRRASIAGFPATFAYAIAAAAVLGTASPAVPLDVSAAVPMSGAAFDAYSRGKTLYYAIGGQDYGAEQYLEGHKVVWAFLGQPCRYGHWYEAEHGEICFVYPSDASGAQCWNFYREPNGLRAKYLGQGQGRAQPPGESDLVEIRQSAKPLECPGPAVGT